MSAKRPQPMDVGWSTYQLVCFARHPLARVRRACARYERAREAYRAHGANTTNRDRYRVVLAEEVLISALIEARLHPTVTR